jgi:methenyltetrahydrofolate cyclohydrolase
VRNLSVRDQAVGTFLQLLAGTIDSVLRAADELRDRALTLAEDDAAAFGEVAAAYQLRKDTDEDSRRRSAAIAAALAAAAGPPLQVVLAAGDLVGLAERLLPVGNPQVISGIAAAAEAARGRDHGAGQY